MVKIDSFVKNKSLVVRVGTEIEIEIEGHVQSWQIVNVGESDILNGKISCEAPLIRQILGAKKGDKVHCKIMNKDFIIVIKKVSFSKNIKEY